MLNLLELFEELKQEEMVFIQCHNFPDHDAIASAYGLQILLKEYGILSKIIYKGEIQRDSLKIMMKSLNIEAENDSKLNLKETDKIIVIDGCKGNSNVDELIGTEIAVIDHHQVEQPEEVRFVDIRPSYGACSTIIYSYFTELKVEIPQNVATALMLGLNMDTAMLTRNVSEADVQAYPNLYIKANVVLVNSILRNYIQTKDLNFYRYLLDHMVVENNYAFCYFNEGCNQNLLGILGDFILSLKEIEFVVLCARNGNVINFSVRNENPKLSAAVIVQMVLKDIGFGGGHIDMAGGVIKDISKFNVDTIKQAFCKIIGG